MTTRNGHEVGPTVETAPITPSSARPLPDDHGRPGRHNAADGVCPPAAQPAGTAAPELLTPTQAATLLQVPESWLRRRAARRQVPCTFLGKHLRFSRANLAQIVADAARPTATNLAVDGFPGVSPRRRCRSRGSAGHDASRRPAATGTQPPRT
jgi:excisionase family DNA binding protein